MVILIVLLYVIAAVLPFLGAWRLWKKATAGSQELMKAPKSSVPGQASYAQNHALVHRGVSQALLAGESARRDLWLIGAGLSAGAIASIWSLFI